MTVSLSIFDKFGKARREFTDAELASLSAAQAELLATVVEASAENEAAEIELKDANGGVGRCVVDLAAARAALLKLRKPISFNDALMQARAAYNRSH